MAILAAFLILLDLYAYQAIKVGTESISRFSRSHVGLAYWSLSLAFALYIVLGAGLGYLGSDTSWNVYLRATAFILILAKVTVVTFLVVDDLRRLLLWVTQLFTSEPNTQPARSRLVSSAAILAGVFPMVSLIYGMLRNTYRYRLYRQPLAIDNLPSALAGLRLVHISDIHAGSLHAPSAVAKGVAMINGLKPDIVLFTGDLVNNSASEMETLADHFRGISARLGVFSVLGNHDYGDYRSWRSRQEKLDNFEQLLAVHRKMGWDLLRNENRVLDIGASTLAIIGVENSSASPRFQHYGDLARASLGTDRADLRILLSHDPSHWDAEVLSSGTNIELTLAGHTHGFQFGIEIPGWIKWSPSQYVYKQWAGLYQQRSQYLYVNRGFGVLGYPGRVGILPEITLIELERANPA